MEPRNTDFLRRIQALADAELLDHAAATRRRLTRARYEMSCVLAVIHLRRAWRGRQCASLSEYAEQILDLSPRLATELARLGRRLSELPSLHATFAAGEIPWTKAREVARVAVPETEDSWLDRAAELTSRELEREVATCMRGDEPPHPDDMDRELGSERVRLVFDVATTDALLLQQAMAALRAAAGDDADAEPGALLAQMAELTLEATRDEDRSVSRERYRGILEQCPACAKTTHVGPADGDHRVPDAVIEEAACDAEVVDARPGPAQWTASRTIPPRARRAVQHRDRGRCIVPGCRSALWLDFHHLTPRSRGGTNDPDNLVLICATHHRLAHDHRLTLSRTTLGVEVHRSTVEPPDERLLPDHGQAVRSQSGGWRRFSPRRRSGSP